MFVLALLFIIGCPEPKLIGNGYCNDETNNLECQFDGGDCCGFCVNTADCTNCDCIGDFAENIVTHALVGDGFCNDETNTVYCNYDGLDCCLSPVNTNFCSECKCHGELVINFVTM